MKAKVVKILIVVAVVVSAAMFIKGGTYVGQGEVGVVYSMKDGVQEETLSPGFHLVSPFDKVRDYPVSQQQLVLSNNASDFNEKKLKKDTHVDAPADGGMVKMNMTVNYNFMADRVTDLYEKFNGMDGEDLVESKVKNSIIAYIKEVTPKFSVMDIYSDKRAEVGQEITKYLNSKLNDEYGIEISSALIIDVQLDEALQAKVQAKEQAKQDAEKAELDKQTAIAQGEAKKAEAEANAQVTITNAQAEAEANRLKSESITDELIKMTEAEARLQHGWVTVTGADTVVDLLIACSIWIVCGFVGIRVSLRISSESELREILDEWETKDFFLILAGGPCILICIIIDIVSQKWHKIRDKHPNLIWNVLINREIKRRHKKRK